MKTSMKLYESVKDIWDSYYEHPFVKGIGDGNLEIDKFKFYMIQDYIYLLDYARVYALGVVKSSEESIMQGFSKMVDNILNGEMNIHRHYMKKIGIKKEEIENAKVSIENISYTSYILSVSQMGDLMDLTTSLLACMWSYYLIGKKLSKVDGALDNEFYGQWIKGYISSDYEKETKWVIDLLDYLTQNISEKKFNRLKEIFINTSKYEYMFWDMAYNKGM
ncbi:thiaminase II [Clostridium ljungdahlii]|uniref:Aminopyrimidine aminohydrolase n=1 Tax=Clostridium ljungdahlii TaxID=1538 RepID=A0A168MB18_9CLOT|nr:thiaminase II [Clostridium ljungdahlii]OAA84463.1 Thiaminase-2 [Clostridium ljungdahlii]